MLGHDFYFSLTRLYISLFGSTFDDIYITRKVDGKGEQKIHVPIVYGPRDKQIARLESDPTLDRQAKITLPIMSFNLTAFSYGSTRKLPTTYYKQTGEENVNHRSKQYVGVPYDLQFTLSIYTKTAVDATKIVEQIIPFFTPNYTRSVELVPEMNIYKDIPLTLTGVFPGDDYEGLIESDRVVNWKLTFNMKTWFYGPVHKTSIIEQANIKIFDLDSPVTPIVTIHEGIK